MVLKDFEVHISLDGVTHLIGRARSNPARGKEIVSFEYDDAWLRDANRFPLEPGLPLTRGGYQPPAGQAIHGSLADSAPDIDLDEGTCSIDLLESAAGYFALSLADARTILGQVAGATSRWREVAREVGAPSAEIERMASAFEHDDLHRALTFP